MALEGRETMDELEAIKMLLADAEMERDMYKARCDELNVPNSHIEKLIDTVKAFPNLNGITRRDWNNGVFQDEIY
jgi:hypothetical protein